MFLRSARSGTESLAISSQACTTAQRREKQRSHSQREGRAFISAPERTHSPHTHRQSTHANGAEGNRCDETGPELLILSSSLTSWENRGGGGSIKGLQPACCWTRDLAVMWRFSRRCWKPHPLSWRTLKGIHLRSRAGRLQTFLRNVTEHVASHAQSPSSCLPYATIFFCIFFFLSTVSLPPNLFLSHRAVHKHVLTHIYPPQLASVTMQHPEACIYILVTQQKI